MQTSNGPWRITFDTNPDDCNLSCIMCEDHSPYSKTQKTRINAGLPRRRMPIDLIRKIVTQAKPMGLREIIPSTMGEPLLYKQFTEILDICNEHNVKLNLTTNGTFPIKGVNEWAKLIVPVTSDVKISWNGATKLTQEKIMLGSKWDKILNNVKEFIAYRNQYAATHDHYCRVTFQLTFMKQNIHELANIVALAIELGVDRVKGHQLWAHFSEIKKDALYADAENISLWNKALNEALFIAETRCLPNGKKILLENFLPLDINTKAPSKALGKCRFLGQEAWVATDGRFNPCCAPDQERRTLGDFGNLNEVSLDEIWSSKSYTELKLNYLEQTVCQKCNMRD